MREYQVMTGRRKYVRIRHCSECEHVWKDSETFETEQQTQVANVVTGREEFAADAEVTIDRELERQGSVFLSNKKENVLCRECGAIAAECIQAYFPRGFKDGIADCVSLAQKSAAGESGEGRAMLRFGVPLAAVTVMLIWKGVLSTAGIVVLGVPSVVLVAGGAVICVTAASMKSRLRSKKHPVKPFIEGISEAGARSIVHRVISRHGGDLISTDAVLEEIMRMIRKKGPSYRAAIAPDPVEERLDDDEMIQQRFAEEQAQEPERMSVGISREDKARFTQISSSVQIMKKAGRITLLRMNDGVVHGILIRGRLGDDPNLFLGAACELFGASEHETQRFVTGQYETMPARGSKKARFYMIREGDPQLFLEKMKAQQDRIREQDAAQQRAIERWGKNRKR